MTDEPRDSDVPDASPNVVWHPGLISREERWSATSLRGATIWFTGLSGSGKSSVAVEVERLLIAAGLIADAAGRRFPGP